MNIYGNKTKKKDEELQFSYPAYEKSDAVKQAETQLQQHISAQPSDFQSQYQDKMKNLMTQMENRPSFQYDADGDALYQYYKDRYIHNGQKAMEDTMGQAAALTGGYGSSYAQNVGQQAYNEYMQGLNDVIPALYQLAQDKYDRETANLQDQYAMYSNLDARDYSRWQDSQNLWYDQLERLADNARYEAEQDWSQYASGYQEAYDRHQEELKEAKNQPKDLYSNGSVSHGNIKTMQRLLGVTEDGYWGKVAYEAAGKRTAEEAWEAYQQGKLQGRSKSGMTPNEWSELQNSKQQTDSASLYSDWSAGDWEGYFAAIRQSEGQAAAEEELKYLTGQGYIPKNMVTYAAIGARGGASGH